MAMQDPYSDNSETAIERRNDLLKDIEPDTVRRAWFTMSHLLLDEGARVVDMGCNEGSLTYAMAAMNPKIRFIGLDKSKRQISKAKEKYQLHNLEYKIGDAASEVFEPETIDAIINSFLLHEVYSASRYNERIVGDTLRRQFRMLKKGGAMFIQEYASPPPGEYVLMEMPDVPSLGEELVDLSEADLLVWYSQYARPRQDPGCSGFFLEELPPRFPRTRLFRLPYKWAYEFILRKDDRMHWETQLPMEYTFYTMREFRRELRQLGARVQYSGPYWDDEVIEQRIEKNIRLYGDNGTPLGPPPTCFIAVAYKLAERKSLNIEERRPSDSQDSKLKITALRNLKTGQLVDVVSRGVNASEIIPYRLDEEQQLKIYLHDGVAKSLVNAVPRRGINIDDRQWSGHLVESVALDSLDISNMGEPDPKNTILFARNYLGLKPHEGALLERGPEYYPSPDYIDEKIVTYYVKVEQSRLATMPRNVIGQGDRFQAKGIVREFDAQQVLNAIAVGMIPNARLELQILSLFQRHNIKAENWIDKKLQLEAGAITGSKTLRNLIDRQAMDEKRFRDVKGTAGQLRNVHSTFVEEGQARGAITGLTAQDVDFVIFDERTINTAVVLPLAAEMNKEIHAGFLLDHMPVPERREGSGLTASAIQFNLPADITNMKLARKFIADKFSVAPEMVLKMGECYYSHVGLTPQKIYPFAVALPAKFIRDPNQVFLPLYQLLLIWQSYSRDHKFRHDREKAEPGKGITYSKRPHISFDTNLMATLNRTMRFCQDAMRFDAKLHVQEIMREQTAYRVPDWSVPMSYRQAPVIQRAMHGPEPFTLSRPGRDWDRLDRPEMATATQPGSAQSEVSAQSPAAQTNPGVAEQAAASSPSINQANLPDILAAFKKEVDDLLKDLDNDGSEPKPEKW